jgi:hypothetical protein
VTLLVALPPVVPPAGIVPHEPFVVSVSCVNVSAVGPLMMKIEPITSDPVVTGVIDAEGVVPPVPVMLFEEATSSVIDAPENSIDEIAQVGVPDVTAHVMVSPARRAVVSTAAQIWLRTTSPAPASIWVYVFPRESVTVAVEDAEPLTPTLTTRRFPAACPPVGTVIAWLIAPDLFPPIPPFLTNAIAISAPVA